jgi:hypothetical protein
MNNVAGVHKLSFASLAHAYTPELFVVYKPPICLHNRRCRLPTCILDYFTGLFI